MFAPVESTFHFVKDDRLLRRARELFGQGQHGDDPYGEGVVKHALPAHTGQCGIA